MSLLIGLAESGEISREEAEGLLLKLIARRHFVVPMNVDLMKRPIATTTGELLVNALAHMAPPAFSPQDAGRLGAEGLKWVATTPFLTVTLSSTALAMLNAMAKYWPKPLCAHTLLRMALDEFILLPKQLAVLARVCRSFAKPDGSATSPSA